MFNVLFYCVNKEVGGGLKILFFSLSVLALFGCTTTNSNEEKVRVEPVMTYETKQVDDFKVSIHIEKDLHVYSTITYVGDAIEKEIYHGGNIFELKTTIF